MERRQSLQQFRPRDIGRVCDTLNCSRAQLAARLGVSRACVSRWEQGLRAPRGGDAARLRALASDFQGPVVDVFGLRARLEMTQQVFGAQFGVSRQQVQKWERGTAMPHRSQLQKLVTLAAATATSPATAVSRLDMLTLSNAAICSGISEKTLRKAVKDGRLPYTVDMSPGRWPKAGRYLIRPSDVDVFKANSYDPYFKKGRWVRASNHQQPAIAVIAFPRTDPENSTRRPSQ